MSSCDLSSQAWADLDAHFRDHCGSLTKPKLGPNEAALALLLEKWTDIQERVNSHSFVRISKDSNLPVHTLRRMW